MVTMLRLLSQYGKGRRSVETALERLERFLRFLKRIGALPQKESP